MATHDGGGLSAQAAVELTSDSESESSYAGSGESGPHSSNCQWRTERFNDQECSRYFDCPTHIVERALSQGEEDEADDEDHTHTHNHDLYEHGEQDDVEMTDHDHDPSEAGTVSPISEESGSEDHASPMSYLGVSPSSGPPTTGDARSTTGDGDEVEITGSRIISDEARTQAVDMDIPSTPRGGAASGTSENPIILLDDTPAQTPDVQEPNITPSSTSLSHAEPVPERTTSTSSTQVYDGHRISHSGAAAGGERPAALPAIPTYEEFMASGLAPPPARIRPSFSAGRPDPRSPPEFVLPRWQPDAEVTYCPICRAQFSIFVRKHHCRKCGRVVCNACSPHRITIPYQYIVQPPGTPRPPQRYPSYLGDSDSSIFGGGERVRLCNPCVPDPNIAPPQTQGGAHSRSQSTLSGPFPTQDDRPASNRWSSYFGATTASDLHARSRSVTMQPGGPSGSRGASSAQYNQQSTENRILSGTPPVSLPHSSSSQRQPMQYLPTANIGGSSRAGRSSSSAAGPSNMNDRRRLPLPPLPGSSTSRQHPPQIAEEDECPVCHRELPPRTLANYEALREAHITICITSHSTYSGGVATDTGEPGSPPLPPPPPRLSGMFPYVATEKDCVDSAECTICLEEFEVGVPMARLECLCRFHRVCISAWWERHHGRCPVHQHDGFGY